MTSNIRIHNLALVTDDNRFSYPFGVGINAVIGEVGSGKSSMLELIKYALGGNGTITPAVERGVRRVALEVTVGETHCIVVREINAPVLQALDLDGSLIENLSVVRRSTLRRSSDFLLDALNLPQLRVTNVRPNAKSQPLSFFDIYAYCYVPQTEIDRSVVNHLDSTRRSKRVGAFELLLGLVDERVANLKVEVGRLEEQLIQERRPLETIDRFLADSGTASEEELHRRSAMLQGRIEIAERQLDELRDELSVATAQTAKRQGRVVELAEQARKVAEVVARIQEERNQRYLMTAQVRLDLERLDRTEDASTVLGPIVYQQCPRCLQAIQTNRLSDDLCYLCGQPEPQELPGDEGYSNDDALAAKERVRLQSLLAEFSDLEDQGQRDLDEAMAEQRTIAFALHELEMEIDKDTRAQVVPRHAAIVEASGERAAANVERETIERSLALWRERERYRESIELLEYGLERLREELRWAEDGLAVRRNRITELSGVFDEIIRTLDMPWYAEGAYIDSRTYLPIVNGVSMEKLLSGGMKMMTNVAYHLALLTYGLSSRVAHIPNLLIIDSPRKNLGSTEEDQAHAHRFYRWISALTGVHKGRFQIIVADNDPPDPDASVSSTIELSHALPLVRDLPHPGEGVPTIGAGL